MAESTVSLATFRKEIKEQVLYVGVAPYSHNIIGLLLSSIDKHYGVGEANKAIHDFGLERLGWRKIQKGNK